ncbi:MAG: protoporphyrinogen/coproporphyrinogen oxidase [Actinomycetota bacterium]
MTAAVLGGGPAGLYAALLLARRGIEVTLFEREETPGGLTAGRTVDGQRVDYGSHRLHPSIEPGILEDLRALLAGDLQERTRRGRIRLGDRWLSFPFSLRQVTTALPASELARLAAGAAAAATRPSSGATFEDVVAGGLGRRMGELFYFPYARKIWGVDPSRLSGEQARRRIGAQTPLALLRRALSGDSGRTFYYPEDGFGGIPAGLARAAEEAGVGMRLGESVSGLQRTEDGWEISTSAGTLPARLVLSTLPISVLARMLRPPPDVAEAASALTSRAMILVYLTVPTPQWTPYDAHYFPAEDVPFTRISEPKNYRSSPTDPPGQSVICVEIPCDRHDPVWSAPRETLGTDLRAAIRGLGLPDPGERVEVSRLDHAYPVYRVGAEAAMTRVSDWLEGMPGLVTFGRQGLFAHDNTHHALAMARDAVASVGPTLDFDREAWAEARERFARHVVED